MRKQRNTQAKDAIAADPSSMRRRPSLPLARFLRLALVTLTALGSTGRPVLAQDQTITPSGTYIRSFTDDRGRGWTTLELLPSHSALVSSIDESLPRLVVQAGAWVESERLVVVQLLVENGQPRRDELVLVPLGDRLATVEWDRARYGRDPLVFMPAAAVTGTVTLPEQTPLGSPALMEVRLLEMTGEDGASAIAARRVTAVSGKQGPLPFEVWYDPAAIEPTSSYQVQVRILEGDKLLYTTTKAYPVITQGQSTTGVAVELVKTSPQP